MGAMASARLIILGSMQLASAQMQVAGLLPSWFACVVAFGDRPRALLAWRLGSRFRKMQPAMRDAYDFFLLEQSHTTSYATCCHLPPTEISLTVRRLDSHCTRELASARMTPFACS